MTRRYYLANAAAPFTPTTIRGAWDQTASSVTNLLGSVPSGGAATVAMTEVNVTNLWDVLFGRWVSEPIYHAGTLAGTATWIAGVLESSLSANDFFHVHIFVTVGSTDVVRGTLLTDSIGATEFPNPTATGRGEGAKTITSTAVSVGDRIVVEIGYQAQNTVTTSFTGTMNYGNTGTTDLASASTAVTTNPGWIEFSDTNGVLNVIQEHSSSPASVTTSAANSGVTTAAFTPPGDCLLVALCEISWGQTGAFIVSAAIADSAGLVWTQQGLANSFGSFYGMTQIFTAWLDHVPPAPYLISAGVFDANIFGFQLTVKVLTGVPPVQPGGQAVYDPGATASTAATVSLTTTATNSRVYGAHNDPDTNTTLTANGNTTIISTFNDPTNVTTAIAWRNSDRTIRPGATTFGGTMSASDHAHVAAVEILALAPTTQTLNPAGIPSEGTSGNAAALLSVKPAGIASEERLGAIRNVQPTAATGVGSGEVFGAPTVTVALPVQTISPAGISSTETLGTPQATLALKPTGIPCEAAVGTANVTLAIAPAGIPCAEAVGSIAVSQTLHVSGIDSTERLGVSVVTPGAVTVSPAGIASNEVLGSATTTPGAVSLAPAGIGSEERSGAATVTPGAVTLAPRGIVTEEALGTAAVTPGSVTLAPTGIPTDSTVGAVQLSQTLHMAGIATTETLGSSVTTPGPVTVAPTGISSSEALGSIAATHTLHPAGIGSQETIGAAGVTPGSVTVSPVGSSSGEVFGVIAVTSFSATQTINPTGIGPGELVGNPTAQPGAVTLAVKGIASDEAVGGVKAAYTITPAGIPSDAAVGAPQVTPGAVTLSPVGITPTETFGSPTANPGAVVVSPAGIVSEASVGSPRVNLTISVVSIPTTDRVGTALVGLTIAPTGISTAEAFGQASALPGPVTLVVGSISTGEMFGAPVVFFSHTTVWPPHIGPITVEGGLSGVPSVTAVGAGASTVQGGISGSFTVEEGLETQEPALAGGLSGNASVV
jgi:hypothetical protein